MNPLDAIAEAIGALLEAVTEAAAAISKVGGVAFAALALMASLVGVITLSFKFLAGLAADGLNGAIAAVTEWMIAGIIPWWLTLAASVGGILGLGILLAGATKDRWLD